MTTISWSGKSGFLFVLLIMIALGACKKSKVKPEPDPDPPSSGSNLKQTPTTNRTELSNDSLFLYAKEIYYWNEGLPAYDDFEPRKYGSNYDGELFAITQVKIDPATSRPYEYRATNPSFPKYSYIEDIADRNPVAALAALPNEEGVVDLEGNGNDIGIYSVSAVEISPTIYRLYILAVDKGSPADLQGITRGAYITRINGTDIGSTVNFETRDRALINATIFGDPTSLNLTVVKTSGATFIGALNKTSYKSNPVYKTNILSVGGKKIGYLAYARFSNESNSVTVLNDVFNNFSAQSVTDLVIDLRYNGGGYISTAEHLVNLIAPSSAKGVMYKEYFNTTMQNNKAKIMKNQPYLDANEKVQYKNGRMMNYFDDVDYTLDKNTYSFSKIGNLTGVTNVVFLVSGGTASASELVINSLKPKMNVKLVGTKTYGKPIGFFPVRIENKYDVFFSMFETKNSLGEGGYYSGMTPDVTGEKDFGDYDFGDPADDYLAKAIKILAPGSTTLSVASRNKTMNVSPDLSHGVSLGTLGEFSTDKEFVGMIENRPKGKQ